MFLNDLFVHLSIYLSVCVCVCVCVRKDYTYTENKIKNIQKAGDI